MKHALIITAYTDFDILIKLLNIYTQYFDCYIHIDQKSKVTESELKSIRAIKNTWLIRKYKVNWGSYKHIQAVVSLIKLAVSKKDYDYYHIVTGNSILIKPFHWIDDFFEQKQGSNFIEIISVKDNPSRTDLEDWFYYYRFPFLYDKKGKNAEFWNQIEYYFIKLQKKIKMRRNVYFNYKGYFYCHLSKDFIMYLLQYIKKNRNYVRSLKYCHVSEEFFFQNVIMDSPYRETVINNHLVYDIWSEERGNPAFLNIGDYEDIINSECIFARKCNNESIPLINKILEHII